MKLVYAICLLVAVTPDAAKINSFTPLLDTAVDEEVHHPLLQSLGSSSQVKTQWHSDSSATFLSQARSSSQRVATELKGWHIVLLVCGGIVVGILTDRMLGSMMAGSSEKEEQEPPADEATETQQGDQAVDASGAAVKEEDKKEQPEHIDYEKLLRLLSQRVMQQVGPKLAKADAVRTILEERATTIKGKAKAFLLNELNYTAADVLKAIEAEEAMVILDWNNMINNNFPPVAVLLAGLLSPTILSLRQMTHMLQIVIGLIPILILCLWAVIADVKSTCVAIPGLYLWVCVQFALALVLTFGHIMLYMKISSGKAELAAKAEGMREKLESFQKTSGEDMSFEQIRELFVCGSVLLQQALLVEDSARQSIWMTVTGAGSVLWLLTIIWDLVLVVGWTFVPGQVAFHPDAAQVAGDDYCGALVTVFVARIVLMLQMLFFGTHILTILNWASDLLITTPSYTEAILGAAKNIDAGMLGIPVAQTLFKAFLLRGGTEMASSQLRVALNSKSALEKEHREAQSKAEALAFRVKMAAQEVESLQAKTNGGQNADLQACMANTELLGVIDPEKYKEQGSQAIENIKAQAAAQAAALEEVTTRELEKIFEKLQELLEAIRNHESVKAVVDQALQIVDMAQGKARELADQATSENIQAALAQVQAAAGNLDVEKLQGALAQAQEMGSAAAAKAKEAAANIDVEALQAQAQEMGAAAAAKAKEATANIDVEAIQAAATRAQEAAASAAAGVSASSEPASEQK